MADINKELNQIKTAIYGKDVRGSIHDGIDKINKESEGSRAIANDNKNRQDSLEQQFDDLQKDYSEVNPSTAELVAARTNTETNENYNTIGRRMDAEYQKITSQLNDTNNMLESLENANAKEDLNLENYLRNKQNIHPKVLYFENGWGKHNYRYWMAYTPYPNGETDYENPCLAVSTNRVDWINPSGVINPLDPTPSQGYNSDTHLVYRSDTNTLEIWWRQYTNTERIIYRRTSQDGEVWTPKEVVYSVAPHLDTLSPAVIFEDNKYKMWFCRAGVRDIMYQETVDNSISQWTTAIGIGSDWESQNLIPWHLDVTPTDVGYEMVVCAYDRDTGGSSLADLFYVKQNYDGAVSIPKMILKRSDNIQSLDFVSIYRASLLKENGVYYLYYSSIDRDRNRHMALSYGKSIFGLNGFESLKPKLPRWVRFTEPQTITDYNVDNIDTLILQSSATTPYIIESLRCTIRGHKVDIVIEGSNTRVDIVDNGRIVTNGRKTQRLSVNNSVGAYLICNLTDQFRAVTDSEYIERVIDSGIGRQAISENWNNINKNAFNASSTNAPAGTVHYGLNVNHNGDNSLQISGRRGRVYSRTKDAGTLTEWNEFSFRKVSNGSPEGVVDAIIGEICYDYANQKMYVKINGGHPTQGWKALSWES